MSCYSSDPKDHAFEEEQSVVLIGLGAPYEPRRDHCRWCGKHRSEHIQREIRKGMVALALVLVLAAAPAFAQPLTGPARAVDGDTLEVQGQRVRLHGIDAPEIRQACFRPGYSAAGKVTDSSSWACGVSARRHLEELIAHRPVTCAPREKDCYGRVVARCSIETRYGDARGVFQEVHVDLGGWMVRNGLAVAYVKYSADYLPQETVARGARLGIWAGTFVQPSEWRKGARE